MNNQPLYNNTDIRNGYLILFTFIFGVLFIVTTHAQEETPPVSKGTATLEVPLTKDKDFIHVMHEGQSVRIQRIQDPDFELHGYFAKTARKCPPFCLHPMKVAPGVETIGEVELFDFLDNGIRNKKTLLIDARTPVWYSKGTIPGSVNYPFTILTKAPEDREWDKLLPEFGAVPIEEQGVIEKTMETFGLAENDMRSGKWDFTNAKQLVIFCNGPTCDQSPRAIQGLLAVGYPAQKLFYYRGGMQLWMLWGLTTIEPGQ